MQQEQEAYRCAGQQGRRFGQELDAVGCVRSPLLGSLAWNASGLGCASGLGGCARGYFGAGWKQSSVRIPGPAGGLGVPTWFHKFNLNSREFYEHSVTQCTHHRDLNCLQSVKHFEVFFDIFFHSPHQLGGA